MFNKKDFICSIEKKAKEYGYLEEVNKELELFNQYGQLEYLYIVNEFTLALRENDIPSSLAIRGASSLIAYILDIHKINPVKYELSNTLFFETDYEDDIAGPRFDIYVPSRYKNRAIEILNNITELETTRKTVSTFFFKNHLTYRVGIFESSLLENLIEVTRFYILLSKISNWINVDFSNLVDKDSIDYMLKNYYGGYNMPNLNGCISGQLPSFYELLNAAKPKSLYELAIINCLNQSIFKSRKKLVNFIKEEGLSNVIYDKNKLLDILVNGYEFSKEDAIELIEHVFKTNYLSKRDELILDSHDVPSYIKEQMTNIKFLYWMPASLEQIRVAYFLAKVKQAHYDYFTNRIRIKDHDSSVGPFFYIDKEIYACRESLASFNGDLRFFDSSTSHMEFFYMLAIDADYGNFPRGRVIYDNYHKTFIVYMDKVLMDETIKSSIINGFRLDKRRTVFRRDSHYTHDGL